MALNKEIWVNTLIENFWPDNSFVQKSVDHSPYVDNKTVHVPNGGAAPTIHKNLSEFPARVSQRVDADLSYNLDKYYSEPILVQQLDLVELSYDKRTSILKQSKTALQQAVLTDLIKSWAAQSGATVTTSGDAIEAHIHATATGNRKAMTRADVLKVKKVMDKDDVPSEGRSILLDAEMYNQLLNSLTSAETVNFLAGADPAKGIIGQFLGFTFYMRSSVLVTAAGGALKTGAAVATDCGAGLAWHEDSVSRALGNVEAFEKEKDPTYYGDILSFAMRAGGTGIRQDKKGIVLIHQGTPA